MAQAALDAYRTAQQALIAALQDEFLADDCVPPPEALGWDYEALSAFFESGGQTVPATAPAPREEVVGSADTDGPDPALQAFLTETAGLEHLCAPLAAISWDECEQLYSEGRPTLLSALAKLDVKLVDRQKFVNAYGKAVKPAAVKKGQPGGGRAQPSALWELEKLPGAGSELRSLALDSKRYQEQVLRDGVPSRPSGLFPPDDEVLSTFISAGWTCCTMGLPHATVGGGHAFGTVADGWACGDNAIAHGLDLRWFIKPGFEEPLSLVAAVRFSQYAQIGRGFDISVHGGAIETCLDEATAECAKCKLFPMAITYSIEFKIKKPVAPNATYQVRCVVEKEHIKGLKYDVVGKLCDASGEEYAGCKAVMVNAEAMRQNAEEQQQQLASRP